MAMWAGATVVAQAQKQTDPDAAGAVAQLSGIWTPYVELDGQVFPSMIVSTATMKHEEGELPENFFGDLSGMFGANVIPPKDQCEVVVEVRGDAIMEPATVRATLPKAGESYLVVPKINWKFDKLLDVRQRMPANVTIKVQIGDNPASEKTITVDLRSVNDCPWFLPNTDPDAEQGPGTDMSFLFAAYVNEDHPVVDQVLKDALATRIVDAFIGYQGQSEESVNDQVFAVWNTLQKRGIRYSSITASAGKTAFVYSQHVRFIDQAIDNQQANCVDGSVLFASVLRKVGLKVRLVSVPGHMYMAYAIDAEGEKWMGIETTLLGANNPDDQKVMAELSLDDKWKTEASFTGFQHAVEVANDDLNTNAQKFEDPENVDFQLIDIDQARELGIIPIAHRPIR